MASQQQTVDFLCDQISQTIPVTYRKMFGEYAVYAQGKVVALVCDDQLYIKPTPAGHSFVQLPNEQPPYPGAKSYFLIDGEKWDDAEWLGQLVLLTAQALPLPKPKKARLSNKAKK
jgi:TfoX/Sxy family transcriptional regulator of competence genes